MPHKVSVFELKSVEKLGRLEKKLRKLSARKHNLDVYHPFWQLKNSMPTIYYEKLVSTFLSKHRIMFDTETLSNLLVLAQVRDAAGNYFFSSFPKNISLDKEVTLILASRLEESIKLIKSCSQFGTVLLNSFDPLFVPLTPVKSKLGSGCSFDALRGLVMIGPCVSGSFLLVLSLGIIHELAHQVISLLFTMDNLVKLPYEEKIYSPIRGSERPAIMAIHSVLALSYMNEFIKDVNKQKLDMQIILELKNLHQMIDEMLRKNISNLEMAAKTPLGTQIYEEIKSRCC